jgi:hypothetical protein
MRNRVGYVARMPTLHASSHTRLYRAACRWYGVQRLPLGDRAFCWGGGGCRLDPTVGCWLCCLVGFGFFSFFPRKRKRKPPTSCAIRGHRSGQVRGQPVRGARGQRRRYIGNMQYWQYWILAVVGRRWPLAAGGLAVGRRSPFAPPPLSPLLRWVQ